MTRRKWQPRGLAAPRVPPLPEAECMILLHCLGIQERHPGQWRVGGWRDHYCPGGEAVAMCKRLEKGGWMRDVRPAAAGDTFPATYSSTHAARTVLRLLGWIIASEEDEE